MTRNVSRRAWRLKRNGLVALGPGVAFTAFLLVMLLGSGFAFTGGHGVVMVVAGGLLSIAMVCLLASIKFENRAKDEAEDDARQAAEAEEVQRLEVNKRREALAAERRARAAEQLPLDDWDDAITNHPRPQPESGVRPELRRGPRMAPASAAYLVDDYAR